MTWFMVDVETDGQAPGVSSMLAVGAVVVDRELNKTFYGEFKPITSEYDPNGEKIHGITRERALTFPEPEKTLLKFEEWINANTPKGSRPMFISDNNGFDFMFVCWYFWSFLGRNPFGHSSTNLGSLYKGIIRDTKKNFKHLRKTKHTHHPVDDAKGNCEALLYMIDNMRLNFKL